MELVGIAREKLTGATGQVDTVGYKRRKRYSADSVGTDQTASTIYHTCRITFFIHTQLRKNDHYLYIIDVMYIAFESERAMISSADLLQRADCICHSLREGPILDSQDLL